MTERKYSVRNNSSDFDSRNGFVRRVAPIGACLHTTSGSNSLGWLLRGSANAGTPASADYLIDRDGTRHVITPPGIAAYHAGVSRFVLQGREFRNNALSALLIGVEMEQRDAEMVTYEQFDSCAELLTLLAVVNSWRWPYTLVGHYEIALPIGRRSDPQGFPWGDFMGRLYLRSRDAAIAGM